MSEIVEINDNLEQRIIEAAKKVFVERGFDRASMSDIAAEAGINRPTLHYYYRTKEKMFEAILEQLVQAFIPKIDTILHADLSMMDKIELMIDEYIAVYKEKPELPQFIIGEANRNPERLIEIVKLLKFDEYVMSVMGLLTARAEESIANYVSIPTLIYTFFGQLTFPFLLRNVSKKVFFQTDEEFDHYLKEWKTNVVRQMNVLLLNNYLV